MTEEKKEEKPAEEAMDPELAALPSRLIFQRHPRDALSVHLEDPAFVAVRIYQHELIGLEFARRARRSFSFARDQMSGKRASKNSAD